MTHRVLAKKGDGNISTGIGTVKFVDAIDRDNTAWLKIWIGGTKYFVPLFDEGGDPADYTNNYSLLFDGVDEYLEGAISGGSSIKSVTTNLSMSAWVKSATNASQIAISIGKDATRYAILGLRSGSNGVWFKLKTDSQTTSYIKGTGLDDDAWHHIVGTWDGTNLLIYIDGVKQTTAGSLTGQFNDGANIFDEVRVGREVHNFGSYFNGNTDECAAWDITLSDADVTALYNNGSPNDLNDASSYDTDRTGNLLCWYRNGDGTEGGAGTTVYDMSNEANKTHLTMQNMEEPEDYEQVVP